MNELYERLKKYYFETRDNNVYNSLGIMKIQDKDYEYFLSTLPSNLSNPSDSYNMYRYWELNGRPKNFEQGIERNMFVRQPDGWHAMTIAWDLDTDRGEFMKSKNHPTVWRELDWYNNGRFLEERFGVPLDRDNKYDTIMNYNIIPLEGRDLEDWLNFRTNYSLLETPDSYYYEPINKYKKGNKLIPKKLYIIWH